jgi:predicted cobalt transporter CbtA
MYDIMVGNLLLRGMVVGVLAGLLCFTFLKVAGEPSVDRAIGFEHAMDEAKHQEAAAPSGHHDHQAMTMAPDEPEEELVSRPTQAGIGLLTGVVVYSAAFGGLFALVFAYANGRLDGVGPRATSALLATAGFIAVFIVPTLKYPANPPAIGEPDTIGVRTALYFSMIAISLVAMVGSALLRKRLRARFGDWDASLLAMGAYLCVVVVAALILPAVNEVPDGFPATVLWQFRIAAWGAQVIMWATIGIVFGLWMDRSSPSAGSSGARLATFR